MRAGVVDTTRVLINNTQKRGTTCVRRAVPFAYAAGLVLTTFFEQVDVKTLPSPDELRTRDR